MKRIIILLLNFLFITSCSAQSKGPKMSNQIESPAKSLPEDIYFKFNSGLVSQALFKVPLGKTGTWLAAPKSVNFNDHKKFPVVMMAKTNGLRQWEVDFEFNILALVSDLNSGEIFHGKLYPSIKRYKPGTVGSQIGPKPEGVNAMGASSRSLLCDLAEVCNFKPESSDYSVSLVYFDQVSSSKTISVQAEIQEPRQLEKNVDSLKSVPDNLALKENGIKFQISKNKKTVQGNFRLSENSQKSKDSIIGSLLLIQLDEGVVAQQELVIPVSINANSTSGSFEFEVDSSFDAEGLLYMSINGVLSEPIPFRP